MTAGSCAPPPFLRRYKRLPITPPHPTHQLQHTFNDHVRCGVIHSHVPAAARQATAGAGRFGKQAGQGHLGGGEAQDPWHATEEGSGWQPGVCKVCQHCLAAPLHLTGTCHLLCTSAGAMPAEQRHAVPPGHRVGQGGLGRHPTPSGTTTHLVGSRNRSQLFISNRMPPRADLLGRLAILGRCRRRRPCCRSPAPGQEAQRGAVLWLNAPS